MDEEESSFPRGGAERPKEPQQVKLSSASSKSSSSSSSEKKSSRKRSNSKDFLFGSKSKNDGKRSKKSRGASASTSTSTSTKTSSSALPLGGGGVLQPSQSASSKKPAFIEAVSFQKLAKGTKLLGVVREVAAEYAVVSLPTMLTGFIKKDDKSTIPLHRVVSVGQFLPVVVVRATSESVKSKNGGGGGGGGGSSQMKRRIELSVSPSLMNNGLSTDMMHEGMSVRGKIRSVEDHGCIIDLHVAGVGGNSCFLKFENIEDEYKILEEDVDDDDDDEEEEDDEDSDASPIFLNKGRIYDFTIDSLPDKSKKESSSIIQVKLEKAVKRSKRIVDPANHIAYNHTIRTLTPGMMIKVSVEHYARNGLCVSFLGNVYRGAIDTSHLGGFCPDDLEEKKSVYKMKSINPDMWWKNVFTGGLRTISARLIAVDPATKIIRFSLLPHILSLARLENDLPPVGTVVENARVVRLDTGVGALLALPSDSSMDIDGDDDDKEGTLLANPLYKDASKIRCAFVHISKAIDHEGNNGRTPESLFAKTFSVNTIIPKLRILSTANWLDNVASCATAESIVSSAVLSHIDLKPGQIYRAVPVLANLGNGGVLVELGGMGIKGLIPATHIFDKATTGDSSYRTKVQLEKYKVGKKVDVRCLTVNPMEKKCVVTAKKTLLTNNVNDPIVDYASLKPGKVALGFISRVTKKGICVTFYNNVFGRISSRRLAEEVGVEDPTVDYKIGDTIKTKVHSCTKRQASDEDEDDSYVLELSLAISGSQATHQDTPKVQNELIQQLPPGTIIPKKSMKIVELVSSKKIEGRSGFFPGHALISIKAKYISEKANGSVTCKLPFDQILDSYDDDTVESPEAFDALSQQILKVGKKIAQEGLVLATSSPRGLPITPIISLKPILIETVRAEKDEGNKKSRKTLLPTPSTALYMGAYVQGFCTRIDNRYGAFIRFLDNLTAIVPKMQGGLDIDLYETVLCKIIAIDVTTGKAPRILLKRVKSRGESKSSSDKGTVSLVDKVRPGDDMGDVKIETLNFARAGVSLLGKKFEGCRVKARLHVTMAKSTNDDQQSMPVLVDSDDEIDAPQEKDKITSFHPFDGLKVGGIIQNTKCVAIDVRDGVTYIELTNRCDPGSSDEDLPMFVEDPSRLKIGSLVSCIITAVSKQNKGIWVQICPGCVGFVPGLELSADLNVLNNMNAHFKIGGRVQCKVLQNGAKKGQFKQVVRLSILACADSTASSTTRPSRGNTLIGRVNRNTKQVRAPALMVDFAGGHVGRCDITELAEIDDWENMPLGRSGIDSDKSADKGGDEDEDEDEDDHMDERHEGDYTHGLYVSCRVLSSSGGYSEISLRESRLEGDLDDDEPPEEKGIVHAFVVNTNKKGCFLRMSRTIEGRVILKDLSDSFLPDPVSMFPPGRLVVGRVKQIRALNGAQKKGKKTAMTVDMNLRESVLLEDDNKLAFDDIKEGEKYEGVVTRIESYGVFVRLDNSEVSGLVHLSECSDDYIKNLSSLYDPGDLVKVLVIKIDEEQKRIGLSMKASHFEDDESDDDSDDSSVDSDGDAAMEDVKFVDEDDDSDDENYASKLANKMKSLEDESDSSDAGSSSDSSDNESSDENDSSDDEVEAVQPMDTDVGFDWGTGTSEKSTPSDDDSDSSSSDDSSSDEDDAKKGHKSRKKATAKKLEEKEIAKMEQRLADGTADENPETAADFERLIASDPNSSESWIKFMAYRLSLADIAGARGVAQRAFDRIEFRQEGEKLNVWTALLTLENKYGTSKTFKKTIENASQHNNPKQVYLRVCEMLEKDVVASHGDLAVITRADEMFSKMCKKFRSKKTVWISHFKYLLKNARHEEAHKLWKQSVKSLPEYKHIETMSKFAQLEYEHGSPERARTIFDALLDKNSKRLDLLFVYVDKEVKHGQVEVARKLFETTLHPPSGKKKVKFSDKQMKSLFKKWYKMEDENGDDDSRMAVKVAARDYVESSSKK